MALRLGGEVLHEEDHGQGTDDRPQHDRRPPRADRCVLARVVVNRQATKENQVVNERNEHSQKERSEPGHHTEADRQQRERQRTEGPVRRGDEPFGRRDGARFRIQDGPSVNVSPARAMERHRTTSGTKHAFSTTAHFARRPATGQTECSLFAKRQLGGGRTVTVEPWAEPSALSATRAPNRPRRSR